MKLNLVIVKGEFIKKINRFVGEVRLEGMVVNCHIPNTGRLGELLGPGVTVLLSDHSGSPRKYRYSLRLVYKGDRLFSIDSQLPNQLVFEAVEEGLIKELQGYGVKKRETLFGDSRLDFELEKSGEVPCLMEVKGVTLENHRIASFPDAPTARGIRHLGELVKAKAEGYRAIVLFVIQFEDPLCFTPNFQDPAFTKALTEASEKGVEVLAYATTVAPGEVRIVKGVRVVLDPEKQEKDR